MVKASLSALPGTAFTEAGSGLEAIESLALGPIDMMVLDLNMPDMHGIEVLTFIRSHRAYQGLPVVVLTTRGDDDSRDAALKAGATRYLTKPFAPQVLASHARELLNG